MFADDLVIFSKGRESEILAAKKAVDDFVSASGLSINSQKSNVFVGGMGEDEKLWVSTVMGCVISPLPVKYLGIPLNNKALRAHECTELTQRITSRLKSWSNRFLSRAGRRVLIISILQSMAGYWARICILPKTVIAAVDSLCANFLWKGNKEGKGNHLVKWTEVCAEKNEGGLGIKNLTILNYALVLKQLWGYASNEVNLWNNWLRAYWTNGRRWWDTWVVKRGSWVLKRMADCVTLSSKCIVVEDNALKWTGKGGGFNVKDTYQSLKHNLQKVEWNRLVWNEFNSPRDAIHAWLVAKNRLLTRDRLIKRGVQTSGECVLYEENWKLATTCSSSVEWLELSLIMSHRF